MVGGDSGDNGELPGQCRGGGRANGADAGAGGAVTAKPQSGAAGAIFAFL